MKKLRQLVCLFLVTMCTACLVAIAPLRAAIFPAFSFQFPVLEAIQIAGVGDIWEEISRRRVPGGGRGPDDDTTFCAIVPGDLEDVVTGERSPIDIWGKQPVFLWLGEWDEWVLYDNEGTEIDSEMLSPESRHFVYADEKELLQSGQNYLWSLRKRGEIYGQVPFYVLREAERQAIQLDIDRLTENLGSEDAKALARAEYFADIGYFADVFRELYAMQTSAIELIERVQKQSFCGEQISLTRY